MASKETRMKSWTTVLSWRVRGVPRVLVAAILVLAASAAGASAAEISSFSTSLSSLQAGGHPDYNVSFGLTTETITVPGAGFFQPCFSFDGTCLVVKGGAPKDIVVDQPIGLVGDPQNFPHCTYDQVITFACPPESQVGYVEASTIVDGAFLAGSPPWFQQTGVFNMVPNAGEVARLGMDIGGAQIAISLRARSDGGLTAELGNLSTVLPLFASDLTIWGVPADPSHDGQRVAPLPPNVTPRPFLANSTDCSRPLMTVLHVDSYQHPDEVDSAVSDAGTPTGCEQLSFDPSIDVRPTASERGGSTGLDVHVSVPQNWAAPSGLVTPPLRDAVVTLPSGVSINPSSADGLVACSNAQLNLGNDQPVDCPLASKIGSVSLQTPLIPDELSGGIYLRPQLSSDSASGQMFRVALEVQNQDRAINLKIPGEIRLDQGTGQVTASFLDTPQLPFSELHLRFKDGARAPLALPDQCGTFTASAQLTGWGMTSSSMLSNEFAVTHEGSSAPCPQGFTPSFSAGATSARAGKDSGITVSFGRSDADRELGGVSLEMPPGLLGRVSRVPLCGDADANAGTCGAGSLIGRVVTGAGAGNPFFLSGSVYLTGPYKGAPFGLSIVVPALAGPFDLGTVIVRSAIFLDRRTAALRVVSDPLPTILKGVPLRLRSVGIVIDRAGFLFNPTSCDPMSVAGTVSSTEGASVDVSSPFQVHDCALLPYRPKLSIKVGGRGHDGVGRTAPVSVTLKSGAGQANSRSVQVTLPAALNARLGVVRNACSLVEFQAGNCAKAKAGSAVAYTPVLAQPLRGAAYFVKNPARALPDLVVALRGQVDVDLTGKVSTPGGKLLRTRFDTIPDVPISSFTLKLTGGKNGPVGVARNLCSRKSRRSKASVGFRAQNGKTATARVRLHIAGCARKRGKS
jgi:hypothetical protein